MIEALIHLGIFFITFAAVFWTLVSTMNGKGPDVLGAIISFGIVSFTIALAATLTVAWFLP